MKEQSKTITVNLPTSWEGLTLREYQKICDIVIQEQTLDIDEVDELYIGVDNTLQVISKLTDIPVETLEELPYAQTLTLAKTIEFITQRPQPTDTTSLEWKKVTDVKYKDFVTFIILAKDPFRNLHTIIKAFSKKEMSDEEILSLNMQDCVNGFFLLSRQLKKSKRSMLLYFTWKLIRQVVKEAWQRFRVKIKKRPSLSNPSTGGTFYARRSRIFATPRSLK